MSTPAIERACPVCDGSKTDEFMRKDALRLVRCPACSMVFASPVDAALVSGSFYDDLAPGFYLSPEKLAGDHSPVRFTRELRLLRRFTPRGKILDVGCSTGAFLSQVRQRFPGDYEILGVDVAGAALDYAAKNGVPVREGSFLEMNFEQTFSAVTFWATLEHLAEPAKFLAKAVSVLAPGGHCFVLVPNFRSLAVRLLGPKYRYILPQHLNYFTRDTLRKLAEREKSLQTVFLGSTHFNPIVICQDRRNAAVSDADRAHLLQRTNAWKRNPLLSPLQAGLALVEKALGAAFLADNLTLVLRRDPA